MKPTWRREDYGYAAATVAAAALVAFLMAGNFGLVPSPITVRTIEAHRPPGVAPALVAPGEEDAASPPEVAGAEDETLGPFPAPLFPEDEPLLPDSDPQDAPSEEDEEEEDGPGLIAGLVDTLSGVLGNLLGGSSDD